MRVINYLIVLTTLNFFLSCSSVEKLILGKRKELKKIVVPVEQVSYGPTKTNQFFKDITTQLGLEKVSFHQASVADFNTDGFLDICILERNYSHPVFLFYDQKTRSFNRQEYNPFSQTLVASYIYYYDFNRDGMIDALIGTFNQRQENSNYPLRLFLGSFEGSQMNFKEKIDAIKIPILATSSIAFLDYDLDGFIDIYLGNWFSKWREKILPQRDMLLRGFGDYFEDASSLLAKEDEKDDSGFYVNAKPTMGVGICDVDGNFYPDILTASSHGYENKLWLNIQSITQNSGRTFSDYGKLSRFSADENGSLKITGGGRTFFANCYDFNQDGYVDLYKGELNYSFDLEDWDRSSLLKAQWTKWPPYFVATELPLLDYPSTSGVAQKRGLWWDFNGDGFQDLIVENTGSPPNSRLIAFELNNRFQFTNKAKDLGIDIANPHNSFLADLNGDGQPELITGQTDLRNSTLSNRLYVFSPEFNNDHYQLRIKLYGKQANPQAIGAKVEMIVEREKKVYKRSQILEFQNGFCSSQSESSINMTLRKDEKLKDFIIYWPFERKSEVLKKSYQLPKLDLNQINQIDFFEDGQLFFKKSSGGTR